MIGIDFATQDENVGLACADLVGGRSILLHAICADKKSKTADRISEWLRDFSGSALLAIDAPLGWPMRMASVLAMHRAGDPLVESDANQMLFRVTDQFVKKWRNEAPLAAGQTGSLGRPTARCSYWVSFVETST